MKVARKMRVKRVKGSQYGKAIAFRFGDHDPK
jgi:hypothetical protein